MLVVFLEGGRGSEGPAEGGGRGRGSSGTDGSLEVLTVQTIAGGGACDSLLIRGSVAVAMKLSSPVGMVIDGAMSDS